MGLEGKVAVVYSGARGIGKAYCEALVQRGCKVYFGDILVQEGTETAEGLQTRFPESKIMFQKCDVLIESEVKALLDEAIIECKQVDIVIANTGIVDERDWEKCLQLNLGSIMRVFYVAMEHMSKTNGGLGGDFVATASIAGIKPATTVPVYTATKHGIVGFIRSWGADENYKLTNIRCNCICPYPADTKILRDLKAEQYFLNEHHLKSQQAREILSSTNQYLSAGDVAISLISVLENEEAKGQCLIVEKKGNSYATFHHEAI